MDGLSETTKQTYLNKIEGLKGELAEYETDFVTLTNAGELLAKLYVACDCTFCTCDCVTAYIGETCKFKKSLNSSVLAVKTVTNANTRLVKIGKPEYHIRGIDGIKYLKWLIL